MKFLKMLYNDFLKIMGNNGGFWIPMAIGAGLGLLKNQEDQRQVRRMNKAAAAQTEFSPLTGMGPGQIQSAPSPWEGMLQGGMAGAQFGLAGKQAGLWGNSGNQASQAAAPAIMAGTQGSNYNNNPWMKLNQSRGMYA